MPRSWNERPGPYVYMAVTADDLELPVYNADQMQHLAGKMHKTPNHLSRALCTGMRVRLGKRWVHIIKVRVEEDEQ